MRRLPVVLGLLGALAGTSPALAYRGLADDEVARLVAFVESDAGQWFVNATSEIVVRALGAAAERTAPELARAVQWAQPPRSRDSRLAP
jgi:hypothetical protein